LIDQFRCGLRDDAQDLLLTLVDPSSFNEAITQAIRCDNRLFERCQEKKVTSSAQLWNSRPTTLPLVPQTTPVARPTSFGPALMQIDAAKFKPLTEAEKLRRRTNNLCLYCGNPRHIARQCPQKLIKLQVQVVETPQ
jgi:ribosomal protein L36